jgi:hypothetical protein
MAVLPFIGRLRLDTTCLVIGSMAPDFEYFARAKQASAISHTWIGLVAWNLPVTLILALAFHHLVKWPLVLVAPRFIARRAAVFAQRPWGSGAPLGFFAACAVSALLGALTHLLWDGITHSDGLIVPHVTALRTPIDLPMLDRDMVLHRVLQHVSTVVGLLVITAVAGRALYRTTPIELPPRPRVWPRLIALGGIALGLGLAVARLWGRRTDDIGNMVVVLISGALLGVLLTSIALHRAASRAAPDQARLAAVSKS